MRKNKYGATRCEMNGIAFDSKRERDVYAQLRMRELAGEIKGLTVHPATPITFHGKKICRVVMDFSYTDCRTGKKHVVDVKGYDNALSRLKRKLFEAQESQMVEVVQ